MLRFLSSLFTSSRQRPDAVDDALIDAATDRAVEGTDKRLLGLGGYRRELRKPVERAVVHVISLVDALPEPVEISRRTFSSDPRLHAMFASFNHMQEKVGGAKTVEACRRQAAIGNSERIYGLLSVQHEEANRLGTILKDDRIQRDVQQVAINFLNHSYIGPSVSPEEAALNVKKRAFDFMIEIALERIIAERNRRAELEKQQILLQRKLKAMKAGNWGFEEILRPEHCGERDYSRLQAEIESVERELDQLGASHQVLARNLQIIRETLGRPEDLLEIHDIRLELDSMNIKAETSTSTKIHELELTEAYSGIGARRILLPGWVPVEEIPEGRESIADAMRYL